MREEDEGAGCPGVVFVDVVVEKQLREMSGWKVPLDRSGWKVLLDRSGSDMRAADMKNRNRV